MKKFIFLSLRRQFDETRRDVPRLLSEDIKQERRVRRRGINAG